jgi:Putative polyhydroxyalkanoic acid system protein (PHA_gran_rgn)
VTGLSFRVRALGQVAAGNVEVAEDHVKLEVTLPWLLHRFAQAVQKTIADAAGCCSRRNDSIPRLRGQPHGSSRSLTGGLTRGAHPYMDARSASA